MLIILNFANICLDNKFNKQMNLKENEENLIYSLDFIRS
jgi:hypothetical protein